MKDKLHLEIDNLALEFIINDVAKKRLHKIVDELDDGKCHKCGGWMGLEDWGEIGGEHLVCQSCGRISDG